MRLIRGILSFLLCVTALPAEEVALPSKLKTLQSNYDAAIKRVTSPITGTYLEELGKLKLEYTGEGDLKSALTVEAIINELSKSPDARHEDDRTDLPLQEMGVSQFKKWLTGVVITEMEGPYGIDYLYDGRELTTTKRGAGNPRLHENVIIEVGKLFVPFTSTNATIVISPSKETAEVSYSGGGKYKARISVKGN